MLKESLERLDQAVERLEAALCAHESQVEQKGQEMDAALQTERDTSRKLAARLDNTIERVESLLLSEEE